MYDPLHLAIAATPLAIYFLVLGWIRLRKRPHVVSGVNDAMWLGVAVSGLVVAGPFELFMPEAAAMRFHGYVWLLLLGLYALLVILVALLLRPRIIIYNIAPDAFRPLLSEVIGRLDRDARWAGQGVVLPTLGVQLSIEPELPLRTVQLVAAGSQQSYAGWKQLEYQLREALRETPGVVGSHAFLLLGSGLALLVVAASAMGLSPQETAAAWKAFLRQ